MFGMSRRPSARAVLLAVVLVMVTGVLSRPGRAQQPEATALLGLGDSLTHGTMDATNNALNTAGAFLQRVRNALAQRITVAFRQPFFDVNENRLDPRTLPTNLAVDGADSFTLDGLSYYKRAGTAESLPDPGLILDKLFPAGLDDKYDKVLYPINLLAQRSITQIGAAEWLLSDGLPGAGIGKAITVYWVGNNDSSTSALGFGGANPMFMPIPFDELLPVLPGISALLKIGEGLGLVSSQPYTAASIDRNLTDLADYFAQQQSLLARLIAAGHAGGMDHHVFVLTLPHYSSVGYLFDSEDLEYYLEKVNPDYRVPPSFARVAARGEPITDPSRGDRVSMITFTLMYALLDSGFPVDYVNRVLEQNGQQRDGLVLSEAETQQIVTRIEEYNGALRDLAAASGPNVHVVEIGGFLSQILSGQIPVVVDGHMASRKWIRGSAFSFDGVHPGYLGQQLIANYVLLRINAEMGLTAPLGSLENALASDPYIDRDGDGWAAGPNYTHPGITEVLFLLKDPDDANASAQVDLPADVWERIRDALLSDLLGKVPALRPEAVRLGLAALEGNAR